MDGVRLCLPLLPNLCFSTPTKTAQKGVSWRVNTIHGGYGSLPALTRTTTALKLLLCPGELIWMVCACVCFCCHICVFFSAHSQALPDPRVKVREGGDHVVVHLTGWPLVEVPSVGIAHLSHAPREEPATKIHRRRGHCRIVIKFAAVET